jgi:hypothetical protein
MNPASNFFARVLGSKLSSDGSLKWIGGDTEMEGDGFDDCSEDDTGGESGGNGEECEAQGDDNGAGSESGIDGEVCEA